MNFALKQLFSLILPFIVLVVVPFAIESSLVVVVDIVFVVGALLAGVGLVFLATTASMFIRFGRGSLAPWNPTRKLVVSGLYSYVRNPMITGVLTALLGETLIFHSFWIFIWLITFFIINSIYFVLLEEPGLVKRFGEEYLEYKRNVPRWIPRLKPWKRNSKDAIW
ncbi:MAG: isoprenylcysteine carboxylmethyltransferase family protein [Ignavibacteriales bacterium]|nr:isoprenylcysteine carboxylmethyltransferase family protein [Ignavibacteriales bacterium]